jgi:hypothetical protein
MDGLGFVFIDLVGILFGLVALLVSLALFGWFGFALGSAINEDDGGFPGMLIGLVLGVLAIISLF